MDDDVCAQIIKADWVPKGWGGEKIIDNRPEYCGKILYIMKSKKFSIHYHKLKTESFHVLKGMVYLRYYEDYKKVEEWKKRFGVMNIERIFKSVILKDGDTFFVPIGMVHQILALSDTQIIEFSTQHFDDDSYRIVKGD